MARATNDLGAIRQIVGPMILYSFQAVFALAIVLPILLRINVKLTLLSVDSDAACFSDGQIFGQQIHVRFEKIQEFFSNITARAQENLSGVRVVRAYAQEDAEIEKFQELNREYAKRNIALVKYGAAMRPLLVFLYRSGFCDNRRGRRSDGGARRDYGGRFYGVYSLFAANDLVSDRARLRRQSLPARHGEFKRFNEILETEPTIKDAPDAKPQPKIKGKIEFRDLNFAYNGTPFCRI
jgi:ATP-binding cassette subfamily B multidrug efflux pump